MACTIHRQVREGLLTGPQAAEVRRAFREQVTAGVWAFVPVTHDLLEEVDAVVHTLPDDAFIRAGDALHLASARVAGFTEIWSNDRHLLQAARHFGLKGRSAS